MGGDTWGGLARDSRQNLEVSQISKKNVKKRGLKWLSCTLFGEKLAKYVLIVKNFIDYYLKAREVLQKFLKKIKWISKKEEDLRS